jgi:hypothetical protein
MSVTQMPFSSSVILYTCSEFEEYKGRRKREGMKECKTETKRGKRKEKYRMTDRRVRSSRL